MKQAEPERGRKRKSSTAHTGAAAGPPATVTAASAAAAVARLVIAYSSHYTMVYNMSPPLPTAVVVVLGPISLPRASQELLEKQWEQTAQFIIDQAGRRNNGTYTLIVTAGITHTHFLFIFCFFFGFNWFGYSKESRSGELSREC